MVKGRLGGERDQTVGGLRKTRHKGVARVGWAFTQPRRSAATSIGHPEFPSPLRPPPGPTRKPQANPRSFAVC